MKRLDPSRTGPQADALRESMRSKIVGQGEAIDKIVNAYQMSIAGMCPAGRPIANFLFLGPTGTGKTRTVEALAESLAGTASAVLKIDCSEFQHSHEISKLIGSPPGYIGHRETSPLISQQALIQYCTDKMGISFVLFDEIEKASDALWNLLLGITDKGILTLGDNRKVSFDKSMIFMTSNLGAREMEKAAGKRLGFHGPENASSDRISSVGVEAARRKFSPEFMNRLDSIVTFNPLGPGQIRNILDIELRAVYARVLMSGKPFVFTLTETAKRLLLKEGIDERYGARHLKRAIDRLLVQPLANLVASGQIGQGDSIRVGASGGRLKFDQVGAGIVQEEKAA